MNIKHENGVVTFRMRAGKDMVRNTMSLPMAKGIIARGSNNVEIDGELVVNDKYFFPIEPEKKKRKVDEDTVKSEE